MNHKKKERKGKQQQGAKQADQKVNANQIVKFVYLRFS